MSWLRLDDRFRKHAKIAPLTDRAFRLHMYALSYCAENLTDGRLTPKDLKVLAVELEFAPKRHAVELVSKSLWHIDGPDFLVNDYLEYNPSADHVKAERKRNSDRQADYRNAKRNDARNGVTNGARNSAPSRPEVLKSFYTQSPSRDDARASEGTGTHNLNPGLRKLVLAAGARKPADIDKFVRATAAHRPSEATIQAAIDACTGPGVRDRIAVALATLTRKAAA